MSPELQRVFVAIIAATPPTLAVLWHKHSARGHWEKQELQNEQIITLVNGRLHRALAQVEARLKALEAEVRRLLP